MNENHTSSSNCFMHPPIVNDIKKIQETPIWSESVRQMEAFCDTKVGHVLVEFTVNISI